MANYRRSTPRHGRTARENSSDWRYPQLEKGNSARGKISSKRRILSADATPMKQIWTRMPDGESVWDWVEV